MILEASRVKEHFPGLRVCISIALKGTCETNSLASQWSPITSRHCEDDQMRAGLPRSQWRGSKSLENKMPWFN
jgi:hypothetical protein